MDEQQVDADPKFTFDRVFRSVPQLDPKLSGVAFVNILFGLVVTNAVIQIVTTIRVGYLESGWGAINLPRLSHLGLALVLTALSWIGYHQTQQYPPFVIRWVNIPLLTFVLDVTMVATYYAVLAFAENDGGATEPAIGPSALPEAALIVIVFALYVIWDHATYRLFRDPHYTHRLEKPRPPTETRGPRQAVTVTALAAAVAVFIGVSLIDPGPTGGILIADLTLVAILVAYRIAKQAARPARAAPQVPWRGDGTPRGEVPPLPADAASGDPR